jgi:bifunctional DNase/RNase
MFNSKPFYLVRLDALNSSFHFSEYVGAKSVLQILKNGDENMDFSQPSEHDFIKEILVSILK